MARLESFTLPTQDQKELCNGCYILCDHINNNNNDNKYGYDGKPEITDIACRIHCNEVCTLMGQPIRSLTDLDNPIPLVVDIPGSNTYNQKHSDWSITEVTNETVYGKTDRLGGQAVKGVLAFAYKGMMQSGVYNRLTGLPIIGGILDGQILFTAGGTMVTTNHNASQPTDYLPENTMLPSDVKQLYGPVDGWTISTHNGHLYFAQHGQIKTGVKMGARTDGSGGKLLSQYKNILGTRKTMTPNNPQLLADISTSWKIVIADNVLQFVRNGNTMAVIENGETGGQWSNVGIPIGWPESVNLDFPNINVDQKCRFASIDVPGWVKNPDNNTQCIAPSGQKCCNKITRDGKDMCMVNFNGYDSNGVNIWKNACIV